MFRCIGQIFYHICLVIYIHVFHYKTWCRNNVTVRFWEECVVSCFVELNNAAVQTIQPVVIIISSCKIILNKLNGETTLHDSPSTRFFINKNNPTAQTLRNRLFLPPLTLLFMRMKVLLIAT